MKRIIIFATLQLFFLLGYGQMQQGFKYQAEVRNAAGIPLVEQPLSLRIALESTTGGEAYYTEVHELTTNKFGLISIVIGEGTVTYGSISEIPWEEGNVTLKAEIKLDGQADFSTLGQSVLYPVPYALYAASGAVTPGTLGQTLNHDGTGWVANSNIFNADANVGIGTVTPTEKLEVMGNIKAHGKVYGDNIEINQPSPMEDPIFVVRNSLGKIVFAVYESGVRMYVDDTGKGRRGGFAVGGFSDQTKGEETEYFRVTPDSVRVNIRNDAGAKGRRGGFAVGGFSDQTKLGPSDLLFIAPDSARIYINDSNTKGRRGGFAVGGFSDQTKQGPSNFLDLTADNYFIGHNAGKDITSGIYNQFMGYNAGQANTTGSTNIFMGYEAGQTNTTGHSNVFIGNTSGKSNISGDENIFIGSMAGYNNTYGQQNVFVGTESGTSNTTGLSNVFIGFMSGTSNISGHENVFVGLKSGVYNTTGKANVFVGKEAGYKNTVGGSNVFLGYQAGNTNNADNNVFLGTCSGFSNTTGASNVFIGNEAGYFNVIGRSNVFIGNKAGQTNNSGHHNLFLGNEAGLSNTMGNSNVFLGYQAGYSNTEGQSNVFLGNKAGYTNTASNNVFIGNEAGLNNTTGHTNSFIGYNAGKNNTTGERNLLLGNSAGIENTVGFDNIIIGNYAASSSQEGYNLFCIGNYSGANLTDPSSWGNTFVGHYTGYGSTYSTNNTYVGSGAGMNNPEGIANTYLGSSTGGEGSSSYNVLIGNYSGTNIGTNNNYNVFVGAYTGYNSTGTKNVFIGYYAGHDNTGTGNVFIGNNVGSDQPAYNTSSDILMIDNSNTEAPLIGGDFASNRVGINRMPTALAFEVNGDASKTTAGAWVANSDKRIKIKVSDIANAYQIMLKIRPVSFRYSSEWISKNPSIADKVYYNFIAQEYREVFPESVQGSGEYLDGDSEEILQLDSYNAQIVSIKAVQELILDNIRQQKEIETLKAEIEAIKALISK